MQPRRILFWAHLCTGVVAGIVILIMCVTGAALAFERQIVKIADRAARAPVSSGSERLPIGKLVIGIWCVIPLFALVLSGVVMSYTWANNLLFRLSGTERPSQNARQEQGLRRIPHRTENAPPSITLAALFERAGKRTIGLRWEPGTPADVFTIDRGNGGQLQLRSQLTLSARDRAVKRWEPFSSNPTGRRWCAWVRFQHTGEAVGLQGKSSQR